MKLPFSWFWRTLTGVNRKAFMYAGVICLVVAATGGSANARAQDPGHPEPLKYEEPIYLTGSVYAPGSTHLLFRFKRMATRSGSVLNVQRDFTYPDGRLAVRERVVYDGDALSSVDLQEIQIRAAGKATIHHSADNANKAAVDFEYHRDSAASGKVRTESFGPDTLIDDMVVPFVWSHWDSIERGEKVRCRCMVLSRRETIGFNFRKMPESRGQGGNVVLVKMEPSSALISPFVEPLVFTFEKAPPHHVLQYCGRTTPKIAVGNEWKELDAVTVFDWASAR